MPFACDPSSLPKYPATKEMDAKLRDEEARRLRAVGRSNADATRSARARDRPARAIPSPEANATSKSRFPQTSQTPNAPMQTWSSPLVDPAATGAPKRSIPSKKDSQKHKLC